MHVLHIDAGPDVSKIDKFVKQGSDVFILVYMVGCGPCKAARPEWEKLERVLQDQYAKNNNLVIIDVNKDLLPKIKSIGSVDGFPTIKYIGNKGKLVESYEDSSVKNKDRSIDSFINWIETKINRVVSTTPTSSPQDVYNRIAKPKSSSSSSSSSSSKSKPKSIKYRKSRHNKKHRGGSKYRTKKYRR
jgi:thiol-disulfide isomerase/thioredoxin